MAHFQDFDFKIQRPLMREKELHSVKETMSTNCNIFELNPLTGRYFRICSGALQQVQVDFEYN